MRENNGLLGRYNVCIIMVVINYFFIDLLKIVDIYKVILLLIILCDIKLFINILELMYLYIKLLYVI